MDSGGSKSESQDSNEPAPPGTVKFNLKNIKIASPSSPSPTTTLKGVKNAKSKLRAFSIQKKGPITPVPVAKGPVSGSGTGNATVYIGKLAAVKVTPKQDHSTVERPPKPPKPGAQRHIINESYTQKQKKTLSEIEGMKRRMELVELGIPLGLICPDSFNDDFLPTKAMPTKAMPPIKTFLDPEKVDEIIREAKKAKAEGKEFKFDYHKLLPDYDNPFQRKKEEPESHKGDTDLSRNKDNQKDYKLDWKYETYKRSDKNRFKDERSKYDRKSERKDKPEKDFVKDKKSGRKLKEARVNLNDYLVCDSWSLDNDDKNSTSSPKIDERAIKNIPLPDDFPSVERETPRRTIEGTDSPLSIPPKLQSVNDSLTYEIDPNDDDDDEILDIFHEDCSLDKFTKTTVKKETYDSPVDEVIELDQSLSKDTSLDGTIDDTFLESVINEIKQEDMSDDEDEKGLVEYDMSPKDDKDETRGSITPELKDYHCSQRSNYSDGYRSTESGYKSTESGNRSSKSYQSDNDYKSSETSSKSTEREYKSKKRHKSTKNKSDYKSDELNKSYTSEDIGYKSPETEYKPERDCKSSNRRYEDDYKSSDSGYKSKDSTYKSKDSVDSRRLSFLSSGKEFEEETTLSKATLDSLETWSFVLKICQPLLFRHDRNKCYKETEVLPKLWYTENPKICNCVEDRSVVYEELEMVKMSLVDRVYGCDQIPDPPCSKARSWYLQSSQCLTELSAMGPPPSDDWEVEEVNTGGAHRDPSMTPQRNEEIYLDREYQRFMQAVLSDVSETKQETSRSTTPVTLDIRKKKKSEEEEEKKKAKKIKLSSEGWSQESDIEEEPQKTSKKMKLEKDRVRKRKHSVSSLSDSDIDVKRKRKAMKKKENKKLKSKVEKRHRLSKKYLKKLKEKEKKNKKIKLESFDDESEDDMKKEKRKSLQKKLQKQKKKNQKKRKSKPKSSSSSDSSSSSSDSSDSEDERRRRRKEKKKRKKSTSESTQSEELFDVNILNNIKKERLTDDEKNFSPRKKPREIINVKELQNDFVENNIDIKKEREEKQVVQDDAEGKKQESPELAESVCSTPVEKCEEFKEPQDSNRTTPQIQPATEESNLSQCSSQESVLSKDRPVYEKDESHLRPSSQNSNYSFNDVISASHQLEDVRSASRQLTDVTDSQTSDTLSEKHQMSESVSASQTAETRPVSRQTSDVTDSQLSDINSDSCQINSVSSERRQLIDIASNRHQITSASVGRQIDVISATVQTADVTPVRCLSDVTPVSLVSDVAPVRHLSDVASVKHLSDVTPVSHVSDVAPVRHLSDVASVKHFSDVPSVSHVSDVAPVRHLSDVASVKHFSDVPSVSHVSDVAAVRHLSDIPSVKHLSDVRSLSEVTPVRHLSDVTPIRNLTNVTPVRQLDDVTLGRRQIVVIPEQYQKEEDKFNESYEQESYEMYEQMAMAYQSDVASQASSPPGACSQRIETVVRARSRGEIKCDWRAGDDTVLHAPHRPSRWGLKPGEVNIVLTGHGSDQFANTTPEDNRVYQIQSIANRTDTSSNTGYDEAYMSMYGASDRLQYGDCFATIEPQVERPSAEASEAKLEQRSTSTLDARITHALKNTVLGEVAKLDEKEIDKDGPDKGILVTKSLAINDSVRGAKRVSFADGYKPGQDSDLEEPPKKKRRTRRFGCAWPCPATHADHVPLWDALPPPPPPPGSPPPPAAPPAPAPLRPHAPHPPHLVARHLMKAPHAMPLSFESSPSLPTFMPPEPPPGVITF